MAWAFELTPEGLKRDGMVPPSESIAPQTARRMDRMLLVVSALALAYFGFDTVSYTHLRAHETVLDLVCRLLLEKKQPNPSHIVVYLTV